jgi:hypothetical protein
MDQKIGLDLIDSDDTELRYYMEELDCPEMQARFIIAIGRGLISGDVDPVYANGNPFIFKSGSEVLADGTITAVEVERLDAAGNSALCESSTDVPVADRAAATSSR